MKNIILLITTLLLGFTLKSQTPPTSVCTSPTTYNFDEEVTWYFDLSGNSSVTAGEDLYFWSWEPKGIPGGPVLMTYEKDMLWSLTLTPTVLFDTTADAFDGGSLWSNIQNSSGTSVTGTLPYAMKEQLRTGNQCSCIGTPSTADNTFFVNFGSSPITNPDGNGFYWTNVEANNSTYQLVDTLGAHRYDISTSGTMTPNNNSAFTTPDPALLGNLAQPNATESYLYISSGNTGTITISCLDPSRLYKLSILGSRNTTETRITQYTVKGITTETVLLQTSGTGIATDPALNTNDDEFAIASVMPDGNSEITIDFDVNTSSFGYINALKIEEIDSPPAVSATGISINTDNLSTSGPSQLSIDYAPANTTENAVTWSIDDESIAIIDAEGNLKPKKAGTITVTATNAFNNALTDQIQVTFSDLITDLYLTGLGSEAANSTPSDAIAFRRIYDADSTITNQFEIFTNLVSGDINFITSNDGSGKYFGGSTGTLTANSNNDIMPSSTGWKHITVDISDSSYSIKDISSIQVVSHMIPTDASQTGWWGGDEPLTNYEGNGVWSGTINFSELTDAWDSPRFYFTVNTGSTRTMKYIDDSKNSVIFTDQTGGLSINTKDVNAFNGEYTVTLDLNNYTFDYTATCASTDANGIVVLGSSVAKGYGADASATEPHLYNGYAYQYEQVLKERNTAGSGEAWNFTNISIGGNNTTDVLNRMDRDLFTKCGSYVIIGLSMANEGLFSGGQETFDQFEVNMKAIIDSVRNHGYEPVIMSNYGNNGYTATQYDFITDMNLLIAQWDVASANLLGGLDNRSGNFLDGYFLDGGHPNTAGYTEFHHGIVPSLFDAIKGGKSHPTRVTGTYLSMGTNTTEGSLEITPEDTLHSFTTSFELNTTDTGTVSTLMLSNGTATIKIDVNGNLAYTNSNGSITSSSSVNGGTWHNITLTHYYALGTTILYLDGVEVGTLSEQILVEKLILSDNNDAPANIDFRDWFLYRAASNVKEVAAIYQGDMLKSSLEIYAPLDGQAVQGNEVLINLAQSLNTVSASSATGVNETTISSINIAPNPARDMITISDENAGDTSIEIFDNSGRLVKTGVLENGKQSINISELAPGLYIIQVGGVNTKFIKN